jgi:hypothetical protein
VNARWLLSITTLICDDEGPVGGSTSAGWDGVAVTLFRGLSARRVGPGAFWVERLVLKMNVWGKKPSEVGEVCLDRRGVSSEVVFLGAVIPVDGGAGLAIWLSCLGVLRGLTSSCRTLTLEVFTDPFCSVGCGWGRLPLGCFDWTIDALVKFRGRDVVVLAFDHDGLFLNGDLKIRALPSESVTASCDLVACCVCLTGVVCLATSDLEDAA